jgi:hypothetical protein
MEGVLCQVVRWVDDEPQPGWVEARFTDALGQGWSFFDKPPIFGVDVSSSTDFPVAAMIRCEVLGPSEKNPGERFLEIQLFDGEADDGTVRFHVRPDQICPA